MFVAALLIFTYPRSCAGWAAKRLDVHPGTNRARLRRLDDGAQSAGGGGGGGGGGAARGGGGTTPKAASGSAPSPSITWPGLIAPVIGPARRRLLTTPYVDRRWIFPQHSARADCNAGWPCGSFLRQRGADRHGRSTGWASSSAPTVRAWPSRRANLFEQWSRCGLVPGRRPRADRRGVRFRDLICTRSRHPSPLSICPRFWIQTYALRCSGGGR